MLPVVDVRLPAGISLAQNGNLPDAALVAVDQYGGRLHPLANRALKAMLAALLHDLGQQMTYTSAYDCYRPYGVQLITFLARYRSTTKTEFDLNDAVDRKWWPTNPDGRFYWVKRGNVATAAVPGTSNHGFGLAVDLSKGSSPPGVYIGNEGTPVTEWLKAHAATYGFSGETQSEPWHWRYFAGNAIPPAVIAYEHPTPPPPQPTPEEDDDVAPAVYTWKERVARFTIDFQAMTVCFLSDPQADAGVTAGDLRYALPNTPFVVALADFAYFVNDTPGNPTRGQSIKTIYGL